jgi:phosphohistidine swiveling domain-containing protein
MKHSYQKSKFGSFLGFLITALLFQSALIAEPTRVSFVRPTNLMVATQMVKLSLDGKQIAKIGHGKTLVIESETGKHSIQTKVGLSLGVPNVTGFNGAKKFKSKVVFDKPEHFYKIVFKPALMGGKHHVIEIDAAEYQKILSKKKD